jgi:putative FmdB family regulatory protein
MPIFEYLCRSCRKKTSALVMSRARESDVRCRHCGGADLEKQWSRFASPKSEDARLDALADPSAFAGLDENDPRSVATFVKKMGREMGEDVGDLERAMEEELAAGGGEEGGPAGGGSAADDL